MKALTRLLIANRGEIAVRIARTARRLGITSIAVCSDPERNSPHVEACDEYVPLGGDTPAESYLHAERLIRAARAAGADAIHPGYGFLAENAAFAAAVEAAGLVFVGPGPAAIAAMGDKARARRAAAADGISVVPGYDGDAQDAATLAAAGGRIGYPLMVKAAAGGGGRGMRRVSNASDLPAALRAAASEARKAFGDDRLILERVVPAPRHVEIQVFGDRHGNVIHLGERDCSVQRRFQKIIEEAPSPAVDAVLRERMGQAAIAIARGIGYVGAGTVEFLLDASGHYYFMEMNTRLQVEHAVTERVTGLDLVELQLRIARGEPMPVAQHDVRIDGHAVEVRLCAEEPADDFLPRTGEVLDWRADELVRCDHALRRGLAISPEYDSLLAKLIAHGTTRTEALDRLAYALDRTVLLGVPSNRAFLARVLRHPAFVANTGISTGFIAEQFGDDAARAAVPDAPTWSLAAWLSAAAAPESQDVSATWRGWVVGRPLPVPWHIEWEAPQALRGVERSRAGRVRLDPGGAQIECDADVTPVRGQPVAERCDGEAEVGGQTMRYRYTWQRSTLWLCTRLGDFQFRCRRREARRAADAAAAAADDLRAAINGRVVDVAVAPGAAVAVGQRLLVLEAMKMEHEVRAPRSGHVATIEVRVGEQVAPGQTLVRLQRGA